MSHEDWDNGSWTSVLKVDDENVEEEEEQKVVGTSTDGEPEKNKKLLQRDGRASETEGEMAPKDDPKNVTPQAKTTDDTERQQDASGQQEESWKPYQGTKAERIAWGVDKPEEVKVMYAGCDKTGRTPENNSNDWKIVPNVDPEILYPEIKEKGTSI